MTNILRKSRSIIQRNDITAHVSNTQDNGGGVSRKEDVSARFFGPISSLRNRRKSRIDLLTAIESDKSIAARRQRQEELQKHSSITHLRRRLVRKVSTFNLSRPNPDKVPESRAARSEHLFLDSYEDERSTPIEKLKPLCATDRSSTASTKYSEAAETFQHRSLSPSVSITDHSSIHSRVTTIPARRHTQLDNSNDRQVPLDRPEHAHLGREVTTSNLARAQAELSASTSEPEHLAKHLDHFGVCVKMASAAAQPPLPYDKLKLITVEVSPALPILFP